MHLLNVNLPFSSGGDKWFGLHALESSSNTYTWTYGKEACDEIENGTYIHWETGYPDKTSKKRCGKLPDGKGWKNTECKHDKKFLCEKQLGKYNQSIFRCFIVFL